MPSPVELIVNAAMPGLSKADVLVLVKTVLL
jgi:hypothetical protein